MGWLWFVGLHLGLGVAAYGAGRYAFRQAPGWPRGLAAVVLGWTWLTVGMEFLGAVGWLGRGPLAGWVGLGLAGAAFARRRGRTTETPTARPPSSGAGPAGFVGLGLTLWAVLNHAPASLTLPVKVVSDGPIYHLYFAARWWQAGRLEWVASPFGENAATYFPAVGDLWFSWLMVLWDGDRLARVGQVPFLLLAGMTVFALARRLGAGWSAGVVAAGWFVTCTPFLVFSAEANVDTVFIAAYLLSAYFLTRHALGDDGWPSLALGALAAGLALGTKAVGVVFVPPLLVLAAASAWVRGGTRRGRLAGLATVALGPLVAAGYWYARNALATGNPLYPLHVEALGRVWLSGWYGPDAMRTSQYYIDRADWRAAADILLSVLDPRLAPVWLAAGLGAWGWGRRGIDRGARRAVLAAAALGALNLGLFWLVVPYRTQQRFMLQGLGLAAVPLACLFDRGRWLAALGVVLLGLHVLTPQGWPVVAAGQPLPWDASPAIPNAVPGPVSVPTDLATLRVYRTAPGGWASLLLTAGQGAAAFAAAWFWWRYAARGGARRAGLAAAVSIGVAAAACAAVYPWGVDARRQFYPTFRDYYRGWLALDVRAGNGPTRVAYAGTDLPYYLFGPDMRREVRYVNVDRHADWLLHDYHRAARDAAGGVALWPNTRPGWDRLRPDYDAWLANLRAERVDWLVVTRANPNEGVHNVADADGFPVERVWADAHPEVFVPVHGEADGDPLFRLYRLRPAADPRG